MDNSEIPITFSEIPPERQSSGLSLFSKLGDRRDSGSKYIHHNVSISKLNET